MSTLSYKKGRSSPKVLLVDPPLPKWELTPISPYISYAYLGAVLEKNDIEVKVLECAVEELNWKQMEDGIEQEKPDIIGIGVFTPAGRDVMKALKRIRRIDKEIVTVLGGLHVSSLPRLYATHPDVDFVVVGEGEYTFLELVQELGKSNPDFNNVRGIAFCAENGEYIKTPARPLIKNLDELPMPAYHLLPMERFRGREDVCVYLMEVAPSRGCLHHCHFCPFWGLYNATYRTRSPELVVEQLELLTDKYGVKLVQFSDPLTNGDRNWMEKFLDLMIERKVDMKWKMLPRADLILRDRDLVPKMAESGLVQILTGVESFSQSTLNYARKNESVDEIKECIRLAREYKIGTLASYIVGWPQETKQSIRQGYSYLEEIDPDLAYISIYTPYPGSPLWNAALKKNIIMDFNFTHYDMMHPVITMDNFSPQEFVTFVDWLYTQQLISKPKLMRLLYDRDPMWSGCIKYYMSRLHAFSQIFQYNESEVIKDINKALDVEIEDD